MGKVKCLELHNPQGLRSIYVCHTSQRYGIAVGINEDFTFHEQPKSVEIWKKVGEDLKRIKRFHKSSILFMEYSDKPFMWVHPRPFVK